MYVCCKCTSIKSWDDCASVQTEVICTVGENSCTMVTRRGTSGTVYAKRCATQSQCLGDRFDLCEHSNPSEVVNSCDVRCCDNNLCNKANTAALPPDPTPTPVKCYDCFSNKNWDDCDQSRKIVSCPTHAESWT